MEKPKEQVDVEKKIKKILDAKRIFVIAAEFPGTHKGFHDSKPKIFGDIPMKAVAYANSTCPAENYTLILNILEGLFKDDGGMIARLSFIIGLLDSEDRIDGEGRKIIENMKKSLKEMADKEDD